MARRSKTGGGVGTNQYQVKGVSKAKPVAAVSAPASVDAVTVAAVAESAAGELDDRVFLPCEHCDGAGGRVEWPGYVCFRCEGDGGVWTTRSELAKAEAGRKSRQVKERAEAEARYAELRARRTQRWAAFAKEQPAVAAVLDEIIEVEDRYRDDLRSRGLSVDAAPNTGGYAYLLVTDEGVTDPERLDPVIRDAARLLRERGLDAPDLSPLGPDPRVKTIRAKFPGRCPGCGERYPRGAEVVWRPGEPARHVDCV